MRDIIFKYGEADALFNVSTANAVLCLFTDPETLPLLAPGWHDKNKHLAPGVGRRRRHWQGQINLLLLPGQ